MDAAWPGLERYETDAWVFRAADGVTQRANSIWPRRDPEGGAQGFPGLLREARSWYRSRRLPVIFQLFDDPRTASLNAFLDAEGFTRQSETLILTRQASLGTTPPDRPVELASQPSDEWLEVWWDVDGRGGAEAPAAAREILEGCPSVYALVRGDDGRPAAVGRLVLPDTTPGPLGGIYCMATHPDARRCGYGSDVLRALLQEGASRKLDGYWLLVTAANHGAQELYAKAGFREEGRYLYRQERPRRAPTGC
ncbi:GNAT family N-acetyltransferase [Pseudarthrobacter sp. NS4]|uniref:GNAT family N-acetyltransferase n=1 Tax=Pseudarthrobacter sp. NS4 TaxID=2973976 RepID=UPI002163284F|nr:GNAT family N-acetyltransferase [Pseudarthrobacter sp. NS4]